MPKRKVRPDPVILEMRLSQVRELISRLSSIHAAFVGHVGWANCDCELAQILRTFCDAITKHLEGAA
jgi:hypothetical protein